MMNDVETQIAVELEQDPILEANIEHVASCFLSGFLPPPDITISQWAEESRVLPKLSSAEHGQWRNERTPYLVEIMDQLSPQSLATDVVFMKSAQVGGTELLMNTAFYYIIHDPSPIGIFQPSEGLMEKFLTRFNASAREMQIDDKFTSNTKYIKEFSGGQLICGWSSSESNLRSIPVRVDLNDEVASWVEDCEGFGDPCDLVSKRTDTFSRKKRFWCSTPGTGEKCRIYSRYIQGDQREYQVPCPHCGVLHALHWDNVVWDKDEDGNHLPQTARMKCPNCGEEFSEFYKDEILKQGQWVATNPNGIYPSYKINALYSPLGWFSWKDAVLEFLTAVKSNSRAKMRAFVNNVLGEIFVEQTEESIDHSGLMIRKEDYGAEVPDDVIVLTAAVDTQDNRLEVEIRGWGRNFENWGILKKIIIGDPRKNMAVWDDLDRILLAPYSKANGEKMYVACALQDAMGHCTDEVYRFTGPRASRRIFACKGRGKTGVPMTSAPKKTDIGQRYNAYLVTVGVDTIKDQVFGWMKVEQPGAVGYMHFPDLPEYDTEHFMQLTGEKLVSKMVNGNLVYSYKKTRERNEALDLLVYNRAALNLLRLDLNKMADIRQKVTWNPNRNIVQSSGVSAQANSQIRMISKGISV